MQLSATLICGEEILLPCRPEVFCALLFRHSNYQGNLSLTGLGFNINSTVDHQGGPQQAKKDTNVLLLPFTCTSWGTDTAP